MRTLSAEEAELWRRVTATIRPLSREKSETEPKPETRATPSPVTTLALTSAPKDPRRREPRGIGSTLDGSWDRKLGSGAVAPDRTLDLHGMSLDRAWEAVDFALERAITANERVLLLVTGHARAGEPPIERGKIRAAIHDWLNVSRHAPRIAAVRNAHRRHGGGGSLYIVLRRS